MQEALLQPLVRELDPGQNPICHVVWPKKKKQQQNLKIKTIAKTEQKAITLSPSLSSDFSYSFHSATQNHFGIQ